MVVGWADDVAPDGAWEFLRGYSKYDSPTGLKKGGGWILVPAGTEYIRPHPGVDSLAPARSAPDGPLPSANSYNRFPSGYSLPRRMGIAVRWLAIVAAWRPDGLPIGKSAIRQVWKPALPRGIVGSGLVRLGSAGLRTTHRQAANLSVRPRFSARARKTVPEAGPPSPGFRATGRAPHFPVRFFWLLGFVRIR